MDDAAPKFKPEELVQIGRDAGALRAGTIVRVVRAIHLNQAKTGTPWFRYVVAPAMPAPGRPAILQVCWERDLAPVKPAVERPVEVR